MSVYVCVRRAVYQGNAAALARVTTVRELVFGGFYVQFCEDAAVKLLLLSTAHRRMNSSAFTPTYLRRPLTQLTVSPTAGFNLLKSLRNRLCRKISGHLGKVSSVRINV